MERHWGAVRDWLVAVFRYQGIDEAVAEELALLPGAEELAALLAVDAAARGRRLRPRRRRLRADRFRASAPHAARSRAERLPRAAARPAGARRAS